ncbi:ComF family protein [Nitratireductor sp. ZSWI3]|uniref:ComF family protein n=1 Tax=Nitratireductor sp. ZSWI3 TaxID=2966359 RepID=UPI00214FD63C|nr:ComF family protein [Nitratireductor sp. ZSWI3]MCR4267951.1 ComF family protein [Nitratireductor sp. ZSWI3]
MGAAVLGWAQRVLFPPVCLGCPDLVTEPGTLCARCWPRLRFLERPWCSVMGTPFSVEMGDNILSAEAIAHPPPFARARSAVVYEGVARQMVQGLKFRDRTDLAPWMARWMLRAGAELIADADAVIPVPLHRSRFLARRFNQSAELGRSLARLAGLDYAPEALIRARRTRPQVGLGAREREANVRGAFRVPADRLAGVAGRRIILVDDVYTTGTTVSAAARVLKRAGARDVDVLTFARVLPGDFLPEDENPI